MVSLVQTGDVGSIHKQNVVDALVKAKQAVQPGSRMGNLLAALENIMVKIQSDHRVAEIIHDLKIIETEISAVASERMDLFGKIAQLIKDIKKLSIDL
ncbi:hypothetical protein [Cardinium endosymbiont of Oedothorax gibbosus]|uniref:hypothetical protein n=1 Tax=Cardinium endosymbiont of Oedothorax gibbosus TaxID=931101 RepID=UPI0020250F5C|nr:hypothetical protein [Cardinium endosymbiont of Oedothorax gibbosus]